MRSTVKYLLPTLAISLALTACGSGSKSSSSQTKAAADTPASSGSGAVVKTGSSSALGATVLTDSAGMTLYALSGEHEGKFICTTSACVAIWHPLSAAGTPGGSVGSLGRVKRPDGTEQVTYKGMPLYTFAQDRQPGEAKGEGIKDVGTWKAVTTSAASTSTAGTEAAPPAESESKSSGSGGGGGYAY
jgi:predicted lipoprotein with Yx(FWY)xxD motif